MAECLGEEFEKGPIVGDWFVLERCGEKKMRLKVEANDGGKRHLVLEVRSSLSTDSSSVSFVVCFFLHAGKALEESLGKGEQVICDYRYDIDYNKSYN